MAATSRDDIILRRFESTDADWLVEQHGALYAQDEGFDDTFAPLVRQIIGDFMAHHDPTCEHGWIAQSDDERLGSVFCVRMNEDTAKLRLFLLVPQARGKGIGKRLLTACMSFARNCGYLRMQLWTHESHRAACALYASFGWQCVSSRAVHSFGVDLVEQSWEIEL